MTSSVNTTNRLRHSIIFPGNYGAGVITYFQFLKWLLQLNLMIAFLMLLFVIVPEAALKPEDFKNTTSGILAETCSDMYTLNKTSAWYEHVLDFIQGTVSYRFIRSSSRVIRFFNTRSEKKCSKPP